MTRVRIAELYFFVCDSLDQTKPYVSTMAFQNAAIYFFINLLQLHVGMIWLTLAIN